MTHATRRRPAAFRTIFRPALNPLALAALLALSAPPLAANAVVYTWTGAGGNDIGANGSWQDGTAPPLSGLSSADLAFGISSAASPGFSSLLSARSLTFNAGASAYTFRGSALTLGASGITQNAANTQTFNNAVILGADQTWTLTSGSGALTFTGGINTSGAGNGAHALNLDAATLTGRGNVVNGVISGAGSLTKTGAGILTLTGASSYTGSTTISEGTLSIGNGGSIQSDSLSLDGGATLSIGGTSRVSVTGALKLDGNNFSGPHVNLFGSASLSTGTAYVGNIGGGSFNQTGGSFTTNGNTLYVGYYGDGVYNLIDSSSLSTGAAFIGYHSVSAFLQSGGSFTTNGNTLHVGYYGDGTYKLSGGSLTTGGTEVAYYENSVSVFNQTGGTHTTGQLLLTRFSGSVGTYNLNGGALAATTVSSWPNSKGTSTFNFNGGTLQAGAASASFMQGLTTANVQTGGALIDSQGYSVTIAQNLLHDTTPGAAAVDGGVTKLGSGTLNLTGANTFTGAVNIDAGTLAVASEAALGRGKVINVNNGGTLQVTGSTTLAYTYNLGVSTLTTASGNTLTFGSGATINGGFLAGPGTAVLGSNSTLNGVTALADSTLTQSSGSATINNATLAGSLTQTGGTLNLDNAVLTGTGRLTIGRTVYTTGTELQGSTTINAGGTLDNSGGKLLLTQGSQTTVNRQGALSTDSKASIELDGSTLVNNGRQTGVLNVNAGSFSSGAGSYGNVNVNKGGTFSAGVGVGSATATTFTFGTGGHYDFDLNGAIAGAATSADLLKVTNTLFVNAGTIAGSVFTIGINSLNLANQSAALSDFNSSVSYHWLLVDASTVSGFDGSEFAVDTRGFSNSLNGGSFSVSLSGNDLYLDFNPAAVPEPASWAMWLATAVMGAGLRARRWQAKPG